MATTLVDTLMFSIEQLDDGLLRAVDSDQEKHVTISIAEAEELVEKVPHTFGPDESPVVVGGVMAVPDKDADPWFHLVPSSVSYHDTKRIEGTLHNKVGDMDLDHGYSSMSRTGLRKALQRAELSKGSLEDRVREVFDVSPDIENLIGNAVIVRLGSIRLGSISPWHTDALAENGVVVSSVMENSVVLRDVDDLGLEVSE